MGKAKKIHRKQQLRFILLNENTLDTLFSSRVSRWGLILMSVATLVVLGILFFIVVFYTPVRKVLPGYLDPKLKTLVFNDAFRLDSLSQELTKQEQYISVVKALFSGEIALDSVVNMDTLAAHQQVALMEASQRELDFRSRYEESEKYNLTAFSNQIPTDGLLFYKPLKGNIITHYNYNEAHYGIDIRSVSNQAVLSVLDGTIIFAGYTPDYNYIIQIQHNNDFVSVYRELSELLKKEGDQVKAGQAIAFIGKASLKSETPHLHFELWYKGRPLNPEEYIVF